MWWRKDMAKMEVIVECRKCGSEFRPGIVIEASAKVTLKGNKAQCLHCGFMNPIEDRFIHKV